MKHYLFYMPAFGGGGAERVAILLANFLLAAGNKVTLAVNRDNGPHRSLLAGEARLEVLNPDSHFSAIFLFAKLLKRLRPDHIHCGVGTCPIIGVLGGLLVNMHSRVVISYHNPYNPGTKIGGSLAYWLIPLLSRLSRGTICVSTDIMIELRDRFKAVPGKLHVIHNPIDLDEIRQKSEEPLPNELAPYCEGRKFILAVGRFTKQKDYPTLIRSFSGIRNSIPHDLVILGQGPLKEDIWKLINELGLEDRVLLPGFIPNPYPVFRAASLFVLSSVFEGFGLVINEALATGTPVVSTDCPGGPREILVNGKFGPLTPVGDSEALGRAIVEAISDPVPPKVLQARARDFSVDKVAIHYQDVFLGKTSGTAPQA